MADGQNNLTLAEAARVSGKAVNTIKKRLNDGQLKADRLESGEWRILAEDLAVIWPEESWPTTVEPVSAPNPEVDMAEWIERIVLAESAAKVLKAQVESHEQELERTNRLNARLANDLEYERAELQRVQELL